MTENLHRFLNAAIGKRLTHHAHQKASRAALVATKDREVEAMRERLMAACDCADADTEFDMAFKLVTDPFLPK